MTKNRAKKSLTKIKVTPLAAESLGVRSMCTLVETPDTSILLDAGISLSPYRFNLPPHPIEFQTINHLRQVIAEAANKTPITTISHYHFDHHTPSFEDWIVNWTEQKETARQIYKDKTILMKNPKENINPSQRQRAWIFKKTGGKHAKHLEHADGETFNFGDTKVSFSQAVPHGSEKQGLGWVIMAIIENKDEKFMFAPDVQGPMSHYTTELILSQKPNMLMLGGPPLYLAGVRIDLCQLEQALNNLGRIVDNIPEVIFEHHVLREENWRLKVEKVFNQANTLGHQIITAAEYAKKENQFLEVKRRELYEKYPPS